MENRYVPETIGAYAYISTPAPTVCAVAGDWYVLEGIFTNEILNCFEIVGGVLVYTGPTRKIKIIVHASHQCNVTNTEISTALFVNGLLQTNSIMIIEADKVTDVQGVSLVDVIELNTGDEVSIRVNANKICEVTARTGNTAASKFCG